MLTTAPAHGPLERGAIHVRSVTSPEEKSWSAMAPSAAMRAMPAGVTTLVARGVLRRHMSSPRGAVEAERLERGADDDAIAAEEGRAQVDAGHERAPALRVTKPRGVAERTGSCFGRAWCANAR